MKRVEDYKRLAAECRDLALKMPPAHRDQLLAMAQIWEDLAVERAEFVAEHPQFKITP